MSGPQENELKPPKRTKTDIAQALVKAGISTLPVTGAVAAELFDLVIAPPLQKRKVEWMNRIAERLMELEKKVDGFKLESLGGNDLFVTIVTHATIVALRNHQREKLEALQNAVVNSALGIGIDENLQLMFLDFVDSLTPLHLRILVYFEDPAKWLGAHGIKFDVTMGGAGHGLEAAFPELKGQRNIYDQIVQDLFNRGLLNFDKNGLHTMMTASGILAQRTTDLGRNFLRFISAQ